MVEPKSKGKNDEAENIELHQFSKNIKNKLDSPFIDQKRSWEDEELFSIPSDIRKGIIDGLGFKKPSKI